jgi:hypothetical protein
MPTYMPDLISIGYPALDKLRLAELALEERLRDKFERMIIRIEPEIRMLPVIKFL